ncbi:methylated-DNA--[protein]-cysteine S-methyltransferase [Helicobacter baculiformis]|uniref:Methylated-DNA--protein-cysteine methyltransferase n=1 Tax=Helicobacter baculiformis TaxID=427351 RepID=A0ABV7ZGM0_9HELI|nr:methylated-DNA--[protein]-cysteine S-methyltransferase [Helicobacter baculiformis]
MCVGFLKTPKTFPIPYLRLQTSQKGLCAVDFVTHKGQSNTPNLWMQQSLEALENYFKGDLVRFEIPLDIGGSPFQKQVWHALQAIPYAQVRSYKDIAQAIGNPKAYRALGNANHANPCPLVIPCHRVVRANGDLGGYGGGEEIKAWLLNHERCSCQT